MLFIISSLRARALSYCYKERERDGRWGPNVVIYWSLEGAYIGVMALSPFNRHGTDWLRVSRSLNVSERRKTRCGRLQYIYIYFPTLSLSFFLSFSVVGCAYECSVCIWSQQVKNVISFFNSLLLRSFDSGGGGCYLMERNICIHYAVNRRVFSPSMWCRRSWVVRPSASRYTPTCITTRWAFGIDVFPSFSHFYLIYFYTPLSADAEVPLAESNHQRQGPADR